MELFVDALLDALVDGVKMLPFLYLAYLLIEWLGVHPRCAAGLCAAVRLQRGSLQPVRKPGHHPGHTAGCVHRHQ